MRECRPYGSERGASSNGRPYRNCRAAAEPETPKSPSRSNQSALKRVDCTAMQQYVPHCIYLLIVCPFGA